MKLFRILLTIFLFPACQVEELKHPTQVDRKEFTILDAKEFFEKDFASKITKSRNGQRRHGKLHRGANLTSGKDLTLISAGKLSRY